MVKTSGLDFAQIIKLFFNSNFFAGANMAGPVLLWKKIGVEKWQHFTGPL